jgi:anti-sigma B factor antagonist
MDVRSAAPSISVVDIKGEVTAASEPAIMDAYNQLNADGARVIILNFTDLDYMNSGGIGMLVTLLVRVNRNKQQLVAYGLSDHYRQIFELTRLDEAIEIHDSEESALAAAGA